MEILPTEAVVQTTPSGKTAGANMVLKGVTFKLNSSELKPSSFAILDSAYNDIYDIENKIEIAGFTDSLGAASFNKSLSKKRADSVKKYLISKGISEGRLSTKGYGAELPIADNSTKEGQRENRRVELTIK